MRELKQDARNIRRRAHYLKQRQLKLHGKRCILCDGRMDGLFMPLRATLHCGYCLRNRREVERYRLRRYRARAFS